MLEVLTQEYNDQLQLRLSWEDGLETGRAEGRDSAMKEIIIRMHNKGLKDADIANTLDMDVGTVNASIREYTSRSSAV